MSEGSQRRVADNGLQPRCVGCFRELSQQRRNDLPGTDICRCDLKNSPAVHFVASSFRPLGCSLRWALQSTAGGSPRPLRDLRAPYVHFCNYHSDLTSYLHSASFPLPLAGRSRAGLNVPWVCAVALAGGASVELQSSRMPAMPTFETTSTAPSRFADGTSVCPTSRTQPARLLRRWLASYQWPSW
jgi:hypothetical protein